MRARPVAASLTLALGLAACGDSSADKDEVRKTLHGVYDALADKDEEKVCDSLSKEGREKVTAGSGTASGSKQSCETVLRFTLAFAGDAVKNAGDVEVKNVRIDGEEATATVEANKREGDVELVKEDGDWKLRDFELGRG